MRSVLALLALLLPAGCVPQSAQMEEGSVSSQPRLAAYHCSDGTSLTVENRGTSVVVDDGGEEKIELPASPTESRHRYGAELYALVLDETQALWMKAGETPASCER